MKSESTWLEAYGSGVAGKRTRWITLLVWLVAVAVLNSVFPQSNAQEDNNASNLNHGQLSVEAEELVEREYPNQNGIPALVVWHNAEKLAEEDFAFIQSLVSQLSEQPLPHQSMIPPFHQMPVEALAGQVSEDGTTLILPVFFSDEADADQLKESVQQLEERAEALLGFNPFDASLVENGLSSRLTGPVGIAIDATALFSNADVSLLIATVVIVLLLLLLIYRSPVLALIPLVGVGFAYGAISPILGWLGQEGWITYDSQALSIMTVLLFGAGTDYCLFLISRFRSELQVHASKLQAMRAAISGTTGAIAMSGFTTMFALLTLLLAHYGAVQRFAIPFSLAIVIMGIATITLVPALLAIMGRASFFPFVPRTPEMQRERALKSGKTLPKPRQRKTLGDRLGELVVRKPVWVTALSLAGLLLLASFSSQVKFTYDTLASFPEDMPSREGFAVISESFQPGQLAPVKVIVDTDDISLPIEETLLSLDSIVKVGEPVAGSVQTDLLAYEVELGMNPYSGEAMDQIPILRDAVIAELEAAGLADAQDRVWIAGQTAEQWDTRETTNRDQVLIIPIVIGLIALLLLVYLRSIIAMLYLIATVVLSYFSALGLGWLVIHYGLGADAIQGFIPLYAFVFLVALGEDYNIFMVSSIWQKVRSMPITQAIKEGASQTGGVITSAGLILAGTFAVLATLPIQILVHFGIITAIGILLDTFVVRPFLVPAITALLGKHAFWPGKIEPLAEPIPSSES